MAFCAKRNRKVVMSRKAKIEKPYMVGYRADKKELDILDAKAKTSGLSRSEFLRRLVMLAEVIPVKIDAKIQQEAPETF